MNITKMMTATAICFGVLWLFSMLPVRGTWNGSSCKEETYDIYNKTPFQIQIIHQNIHATGTSAGKKNLLGSNNTAVLTGIPSAGALAAGQEGSEVARYDHVSRKVVLNPAAPGSESMVKLNSFSSGYWGNVAVKGCYYGHIIIYCPWSTDNIAGFPQGAIVIGDQAFAEHETDDALNSGGRWYIQWDSDNQRIYASSIPGGWHGKITQQ